MTTDFGTRRNRHRARGVATARPAGITERGLMKRFIGAFVALVVAAGGAAFAAPAVATQPDFICEGYDSGKIDTVGDPATVEVTAPEGKLISGYCVKAGTEKFFIEVDPPSKTVVVDHPTKDSVSHYSLVYVDAPVEPVTVRINLTYIEECALDADNTWRVRNPSDKTITVTWRNASNTRSGTHTATPGDTFFATPRGTETMIISWGGGDSGIVAGSVTKASGNDIPSSNPKCLPPAEECIATNGVWFTENDDTVPTLEENGLRFVGGVNDSVGTGIAITSNLQGLPEITYVAEGDAYSMARFYPRLVINSSADGGPAYNSVTVTSEGPVNASSVASARLKLSEGGTRVSKTIAEWIAYYPNNQLLAFFFNTDSSSNAQVSVLLKSVSAGECFEKAWGYGLQPETKVEYGDWVTGEYDCDDTVVTETRDVFTTTFSLVEGQWVGSTVTTSESRERALTAEEIDALLCPGEKPEPIVEVEQWETTDCEAGFITTTTVTTTTDWELSGEEWVQTRPTSVIEQTTREVTAEDCPPAQTPEPREPLAYTGGVDMTPIGFAGGAALLTGLGLAVFGYLRRKALQ